MDLYKSIIVAIWLCVVYAIWAATEAGDPGYGQVAFLAGGIFAHLYLRKRKLERPRIDNSEIEIPDAKFSVEIPDEGDKYYFSESSYRKIIWISTILSLVSISIFIETLTYQQDYLRWGIVALIFGLIVFIIPIFLPIKDDIEVCVDPSLLRPADVTMQIPSTQKFKGITGWEPDIPYEQTLKDMLEYWRIRVGEGLPEKA